MKTCPQCHVTYDDDSLFCLADGNALLDNYDEQETVAIRRFGFADDFVTGDKTSVCLSCGFENRTGSKFCKKCGQTVDGNLLAAMDETEPFRFEVNRQQQVFPNENSSLMGKTVVFKPPVFDASQSTVAKSGINKPVIVGAGVFGGILLSLVTFVLLGPGDKPPVADANAAGTSTNQSEKSSFSELPQTFDRNYDGFIAGRPLRMNLKRSGAALSGTASTTSSDTLDGEISDSGEFRADAYENGDRYTGIFSGRIHSDGSVTGNWTTTSGTKARAFSLQEEQ